jgi:hypothetical protein
MGFRHCWSCGSSLITNLTSVVPISHVVRQKYLLQVMHHGSGVLGGSAYPAGDFFTMLHRFCTLVSSSKFANDLRNHMLLYYRLRVPIQKKCKGEPIYILPEVLDASLILLANWPFNFIKAARDAKMSHLEVTKYLVNTVFAFEHFPIPP